MKIGIDCRMWSTTTGRRVREIVAEIAKQDSENEYVLFFLDEDINKVKFPPNFKKIPANIKWHTFAEQLILPFIFLKEDLDLLHVPHFNIPILYPKKFIVTIHDLTIMRVNTGRATTLFYPFYLVKRLGFRVAMLSAIFRSNKVVTVSNFVKNDIVSTFKIKNSKVLVAPNAVSGSFKKATENEVFNTLPKYKIKQPYLFYVGNAHPHKNVEGLLKAFEQVSQTFPELQLVLGGEKYFFYERIEKEWKNSPIFAKLNFTGFIEDEDLPALYTGAEAFVNPSKYEGFGLQILEAFSCGTKVISSNTTSLPEVGGAVAYYFDPQSADDMSQKIAFALEDNENREREGYEQIKKFSWSKSARKVLGIYKTI